MAEIDEIVRLQGARTAATDSVVRAWSGDPGASWSRMAVERLDFYWPLLPDVRIAMLTGTADTAGIRAAGADAIVPKPFDPAVLVATVEGLAARAPQVG